MSWLISKDKYKAFLNTPSNKWREKGNNSFKAHRYDDAIEEYSIALILADNVTERPSRTLPGGQISSVPRLSRALSCCPWTSR
jgi:hypothetical protein